MLGKQIAYFKKHQKRLAREHHRKYVLIHDDSVIDVFESEIDAYVTARNRYKAGTFLIRQCLNPEEESVHVFHSRVAV